MAGKTSQLQLEDFLAQKIVDWYEDPDHPGSYDIAAACKRLACALSGTSDFIDANSASGAVRQFMFAFDNSIGWTAIENQLRAMTEEELEDLHFPDLLHMIVVVDV